MHEMFNSATSFNQPLNEWDTSNVRNMSFMFTRATSFNKPLNEWDTSNVTKMTLMFYNAESFDQLLDKWNISNVERPRGISNIFGGSGITRDNYCKLFKGAYGTEWEKRKESLGKSYICD